MLMVKKKKKNRLLIAIFVILFLIIGIVVGAILYVKNSLKVSDDFINGNICDNGATGCEITPFVVDEGAWGKSTIVKLSDTGIIKNSDIVYTYTRIMGPSMFYAGYYEIPHQMSDEYGNVHDITLDELLAFLADSKNAHQDTVWIKLEEGDFARGFAKTIAESVTLKENPTDDVNAKAQTLLDYWNDPDVVRSYMSEYPFLTEEILEDSNVKILLEGYLFPETYEFFEYSSCDQITRRFLDQTLIMFEKYKTDFDESTLSYHQLFTLASILQWESGSLIDTEAISGVFYNRLRDGADHGIYTLGSTVTTCYAFDMTKDECFTLGDLEEYSSRPHPYNTYQIEGLPPGPVCNPGEISLYAALNPEENGYYYFGADLCNGGTVFAVTYEQHLSNMDRYYVPCS